MANGNGEALKLYKVRDSQTGKEYQIRGPADATDEELDEFLSSNLPAETGEASPSPAPTPTPVSPGASPAEAPAPTGVSRTPVPAQAEPRVTAEVSPYGQMGSDEDALWRPDPLRVKPQRLPKDVEQAYYSEISRRKGDPTFSQRDVDAFWTSRGYAPMQASDEFIQAVREGRDTGGIDYSSWDAEQQRLEDERMAAAREDFAQNKALEGDYASAVDEAAQRGFWGIASRTLQDWFDTNKEELRKQYPNASDEELEELADQDIIRRSRAARAHYEEANKDSGWVPWLAGQFTGSLDPTAFIAPGASAGGRILGNAGVAAGTEGVFETIDAAQGVTDNISPENIALAALFGGGLQGVIEGGGAVLNRLRSKISSTEALEAEAGSPISSEDFQALGERLGVATDEEVANLTGGRTAGEIAPEAIQEFTQAVPEERLSAVPGMDEADVNAMMRGEPLPSSETVRDPSIKAPVQRVDVEERVSELSKNWKNAPEFELVESLDQIADPTIRAAVDDPTVVGFYGPDGKVRILSNNLEDAEQIGPALFHEALGHHGMRQRFGDELDNFMQRLHDGSPELRSALERWRAERGDDYGDVPLSTQVEEVLAQMSEAGDLSRKFAKRTVDRIKDFLKNFARTRLGMDLEYSPREVMSILASAHEMVTRGADTGFVGDGLRLLRAWHVSPHLFRNVDPDNPYGKFDERYRSTGEGAQAYGQGVAYVTEGPEVRDSYIEQFSSDKLTINGRTGASINDFMDAVQTRVAQDNTHLMGNAIGQHSIMLAQDYSWQAAQLARDLGRTPTPDEILKHVTRNLSEEETARLVESASAKAAARILSKAVDKVEWSSQQTRPYVYEVDLPDDGNWVVRDEAIAAQPALRKFFEDDGFVFRSPEEIEKLRAELRDAEMEVKWGESKDYLANEEKAAILREELENTLPDTLKADELEPQLAGLGMSDVDVSNMLRDAGFTGFKYKDGFSRQGKSIEPTYNYVPFRSEDAKIVGRTGGPPEADVKYMRRSQEPRKPINLTNIRSTRDVSKVVDDLLEGYEFDPQTREETAELANRLGLTPSRLANRKVVDIQRFPEFAEAAAGVLEKQTGRVRELARQVNDTSGDTTETRVALQTELAKLGALYGKITGFSSSAGRALNALSGLKAAGRHPKQILEALTDLDMHSLSGDDIVKLATRIDQLEDTADVVKLAHDAFEPRLEDYAFSVWYNMNLLSRLSTQMNNIIGTGGHLAGELGAQHIAWALGLPKKLTGNGNRIATRELVARYAGLGMGALQGIMNAGKAFRLGMPVSGPSKEAYRPLPLWEAAQKFNTEGAGSRMPQVLRNTVNEAAVIAELPSRMMAVTDEFFRSIASLSDYYGRAVRTVLMDEDGATGALAPRVYSLMRQPTEEMKKAGEAYSIPANEKRNENLAKSHELSRRITFRDELTQFGKGVEKALRTKDTDTAFMRGARFAGRVLVPFYRMGERMLASNVRFAPGLGLASRTNRAGIAGGGADRDVALGRQLLGLGLGYLAIQQWMDGTRSGAGPSDYERRAELEESGWRANSVLLPDGKTWFRTEGLDPLNSYMNAVVTTMEKYAEGLLDEEDTADQLFAGASAAANWMASQAGVENLFRLIGGVEDPEDTGAKNAVAGIIGSFATPGIVQSFNQSFEDPAVRSTRGDGSLGDRISGRIQAAYPSALANPVGLEGSSELPQRHGPLGTPLERRGGWLNFMFGDRFSTSSEDPAIREMARLGGEAEGKAVVGLPDRTITVTADQATIGGKVYEKGEKAKLTEEDYQKYVRLSGYWTKNGFTNFMQTEEYQNMSDAERLTLFKGRDSIPAQARKAAREYLFGETEDMDTDLVDALMDSARMEQEAAAEAEGTAGYGDEE